MVLLNLMGTIHIGQKFDRTLIGGVSNGCLPTHLKADSMEDLWESPRRRFPRSKSVGHLDDEDQAMEMMRQTYLVFGVLR